jgi:hypothetical protein
LVTPTQHGLRGGLRRSTVAKIIDDPSNVSTGVAAADRTFLVHRRAAVSWTLRPRDLRVMRTTPHGHGYDPTPVDRKFNGARPNRTRGLKPAQCERRS